MPGSRPSRRWGPSAGTASIRLGVAAGSIRKVPRRRVRSFSTTTYLSSMMMIRRRSKAAAGILRSSKTIAIDFQVPWSHSRSRSGSPPVASDVVPSGSWRAWAGSGTGSSSGAWAAATRIGWELMRCLRVRDGVSPAGAGLMRYPRRSHENGPDHATSRVARRGHHSRRCAAPHERHETNLSISAVRRIGKR